MRPRQIPSHTLQSAKQAVCTAPEDIGVRLRVAQATTAWVRQGRGDVRNDAPPAVGCYDTGPRSSMGYRRWLFQAVTSIE